MKKIYFAALAVAALTFAACGNSTKPAEEVVDSTEVAVEDVDVNAELDAVTAALASNDEAAVTEGVTKVQTIIQKLAAAGNTELAVEYAKKVQEWYETNKEKVAEVVKNSEVLKAAVEQLPTTTEAVKGYLEQVGISADALGEAAAEQAGAAAEQVDKAKEQINAAKEKIEAAPEQVKAKAEQAATEARDAAKAKAQEEASKAAGKAVDKLLGGK